MAESLKRDDGFRQAAWLPGADSGGKGGRHFRKPDPPPPRPRRVRTGRSRAVVRKVALVVIAVAICAVVGVVLVKAFSGDEQTGRLAPLPAANRGPTTTNREVAQPSLYTKGQCITWDQSDTAPRRSAAVVSCDTLHLLEIAGSVDVGKDFESYPSDSQWQSVYDTSCAGEVTALIGGPLDPAGMYSVGGFNPTVTGWAEGDRRVWCGARMTRLGPPIPGNEGLVPFTGRVEGASQALILPAGACGADAFLGQVPCSQPHDWEVTGTYDLTGKVTTPPAVNDTAGWQALVGSACQGLGRTYLGHSPSGDVNTGWVPIEPGSWAAGRRVVDCVVAHYQNNVIVSSTGSLKG